MQLGRAGLEGATSSLNTDSTRSRTMNNARNHIPVEPVEEVSGTRETNGVAALAFGKLVSAHLDFVWRSLKRLGVPAGEVDDATQQVFLVANEKLANIKPGRERSFLLAVAGRVASHARRADQRRQAATQRLSEGPPPEGTPDPEHLTQRLEARDLLDQVLDMMPPKVRTVFVLFELEDLSVDEVADLLSLPRGTVATRLRRARTLFREGAQLIKEQQRGGEA